MDSTMEAESQSLCEEEKGEEGHSYEQSPGLSLWISIS